MAHVGRPWTDYKPPASAPVWAAIEGLGRYYILVAALELDLFDSIQKLGPSTVEQLSQELSLPTAHLRSLLDSVVALELLEQVRDVYDLNDAAKRYLVSNGPATMAGLVPVAPGPHENWTRLADTVRRGRPATPIEDDPAAFYLPLVEGTFTTMHRCATRADLKLRYSAMLRPRVLDLGAGLAPWAVAVLEQNEHATAVINDIPEVLVKARENVASFGLTDRVEFRPGDFHQVQLEDEGYDLVVLGHICRTEGAQGAENLIRRSYTALAPGGRLVLSDYFLDRERKLNPHAVLMGATMMASTTRGFTFTHEEFSNWLSAAGFREIRLIEPIGFQQCFIAVKPSPKGMN